MAPRLARFSYGVLCLCLLSGLAALLLDIRLALLPAAFAFGWSQLGGL
jgi:hypothetical protein